MRVQKHSPLQHVCEAAEAMTSSISRYLAPTNAFDARADDNRALDDGDISFGVPVVPDVPITTAACAGANSEMTSPNPEGGSITCRELL